MDNFESQIADFISRDNLPKAVEIAQSALSSGHESALIFNLVAYQLELEGDYSRALGVLHRGLQVAPNDPLLRSALGDCLSKSGRPAEALKAFEAAVSIHPEFARGHQGRGVALSALGDPVGALEAFRTAFSIDPLNGEPLGAIAALAFERSDFAEARSHAIRALELDPGQPAAVLTLSMIQLREGQYQDVEVGISALLARGGLSALHQASAYRVLADALDLLDRPNDAFPAYEAANAALRHVYVSGANEAGIELGVELCRRLKCYFEQRISAPWSAPATEDVSTATGGQKHVFLLGFPRSGTTLLEQVLASHPSIVALEEKSTIEPFLDDYFDDAAALDRLMALSVPEADFLRREYWRRVAGFGVDRTSRVFIDKTPLNTIFIPLIAKLFPDSKILFCLRDPRDVVLSCFRRRFQPNKLVVEYTDLVRTAEMYDSVMQLAELYKSWIPIAWYVHRHESLVEDFDEETRAVCKFLDLEWSDRMRDFASTAKRRDIRTPSAAQVRRGLTAEGVGQWRRYAASIKPAIQVIDPWVKKYGYFG